MFHSPRTRPFIVLVVLAGLGAAAAVRAADLPAHAPDANQHRDRIPDVWKWDLGPLFPSDAAWEATLDSLDAAVDGLAAYRGTLSNPGSLKGCLDLYFALHNRATHVQQYASLSLNTALTDEGRQAMHQRALALVEKLTAAAGFIRVEALALDDGAMARAYAEPGGPAEHRGYLDELRRRRARVLAADGERVLQMAGDNLWAEIDLNELPSPLEDAFNALLSDITWPVIRDDAGKEVQLNLSNFTRYRASADRRVRAETMTALFSTLRRFQHSFAAVLGGQFELDVFYARARGYDTALEAYLDKDHLDPAVHDNLIAAVNANLRPLHRYVELRRKVLGLPDLHLYDLYVPLAASAAREIPYQEAMRVLPEALAPLGGEYVNLLVHGLDPRNGWVDVYPSDDKESGAFSASVYGRHPYVKMNYQNAFDDLSTLAHEFGHAVHAHLAMTHQPYPGWRYVAFLAEIASTCNEALLSDYLIAHAATPKEKAALLVEELETLRTTIYRQTLFSEFERLVHGFVEEGRPITASLLDETYRGLVQRYYGPGFTVDENDGMEWAYIPHFYYKYYVYSYATGLSSGIAIAERVKSMGKPAVEAYLGMLEGGGSRPPLELLRGAGVDLTRPDAIESALRRFDRIVTDLAALLDVEID